MTAKSQRRQGSRQAGPDAAREHGHGSTSLSAEQIEALARRVAPLVVSLLATALGATQAPYSTRPGHEPPEYRGRSRRWKADAPHVPGAVRVGRWWSIPRDAYTQWLQAQSSTADMPQKLSPAPANDADWQPEPGDFGLRRAR